MRQFKAKIRLSGSLYNEVAKSGLSIAEIMLLRIIHGGESVVEIAEIDPVDTLDPEERERLVRMYGQAISSRQSVPGGIGSLIGLGGALPDSAPGIPAMVKATKGKAAVKMKEPEVVDPPAPEDPEE